MRRYTLVDLDARRRRAALRDENGAYHIALVDSRTREIGTAIEGPQARQGYALLREADTGLSMHAIFSAIHCTQEEALARLHPL